MGVHNGKVHCVTGGEWLPSLVRREAPVCVCVCCEGVCVGVVRCVWGVKYVENKHRQKIGVLEHYQRLLLLTTQSY